MIYDDWSLLWFCFCLGWLIIFLVWVMSWLLWFICLMFLWYCYDFLLNDVFEVWFYEIVMKWWLEDVLERLSWEIVLKFLLNEVLEWCFFEIVMKWWWKCREGCRVMMMMGRWARPTLTYIYTYIHNVCVYIYIYSPLISGSVWIVYGIIDYILIKSNSTGSVQ